MEKYIVLLAGIMVGVIIGLAIILIMVKRIESEIKDDNYQDLSKKKVDRLMKNRMN